MQYALTDWQGAPQQMVLQLDQRTNPGFPEKKCPKHIAAGIFNDKNWPDWLLVLIYQHIDGSVSVFGEGSCAESKVFVISQVGCQGRF